MGGGYQTLVPLLALGLLLVADASSPLPGARPRNVTAVLVGGTGVKLTWAPPRSLAGCPVKRYLIRLKPDSDRRSKTWKVDGLRHELSLHDLRQDSTYSLRLVAVNSCGGKGAPTRWLRLRTGRPGQPDSAPLAVVNSTEEVDTGGTEERAPGSATHVRTRTYVDSAMLSWRAPTTTPDVRVRGYMVGYGENVPDINWQYVGAGARNVTIKNLKSSTQYVLSLRAFNNYGKGPVSYELVYTRSSHNPTALPFPPPEHLKAKVLSPTTVWLQWTDPSLGPSKVISDNRYYRVEYQPLPSGRTMSLIVKALHVVLYDLHPGTTYLFKVRTTSLTQSSQFSLAIQNRTFETVPTSAPRSVAVVPSNESTAALVSWRPPRQPNGHITAYLVTYTTSPKSLVSTWSTRRVVGMSTHVRLSGLTLNSTYYLKVQAQNSQGYGPSSSSVSFDTPTGAEPEWSTPTAPVPAPLSGHHQLTDAAWDDEEGTGRALEGLMDDEDEDEAGEEPRLARTEWGEREMDGVAEAQEGQEPEPVLELSVQSVVKHSVTAVVTWREECGDEPAQPVRYVVKYEEQGQGRPLEKSSPTTFVLLDNLRPNTRYLYRVRRLAADGTESPWSSPYLLDTSYPQP